MTLEAFRVERDEFRTRVQNTDDILGWGIKFPSGRCYVEWNRSAFPEPNRLDNNHISVYGSFTDVEQGTGGKIIDLHEVHFE